MENRFNNRKFNSVRNLSAIKNPVGASTEKLASLAYKAYRQHRYDDALTLISKIENEGGKLPLSFYKKLIYFKGDILLEMKRFKEAVKCYSQILKKEKTEIAFCNKALSLWELNHFRSALSNYLNAIELNSVNEITQRGAGEMYLKLNQPELAIPYFKKAISLNSEYIEAITGLGVALLKVKKWSESYCVFERALAIDPTDELSKKWLSALDKALAD